MLYIIAHSIVILYSCKLHPSPFIGKAISNTLCISIWGMCQNSTCTFCVVQTYSLSISCFAGLQQHSPATQSPCGIKPAKHEILNEYIQTTQKVQVNRIPCTRVVFLWVSSLEVWPLVPNSRSMKILTPRSYEDAIGGNAQVCHMRVINACGTFSFFRIVCTVSMASE